MKVFVVGFLDKLIFSDKSLWLYNFVPDHAESFCNDSKQRKADTLFDFNHNLMSPIMLRAFTVILNKKDRNFVWCQSFQLKFRLFFFLLFSAIDLCSSLPRLFPIIVYSLCRLLRWSKHRGWSFHSTQDLSLNSPYCLPYLSLSHVLRIWF